jgi:D-3-phosphoglycerate dehydrogenase
MSHTIFVTAPTLAPEGAERLRRAGCRVIYLGGARDAAEVERVMAAEPIHAVISRTVDLTARAIDACPTLRVVSKHGVGVSNIDVSACTRRGIPVYVTPGANAQSVAELTIALMLAAARKVAWMDREIRQGRWPRAQDGIELCGRTLGLVGFGQVGRRVSEVALAIGMTVRAFDTAPIDSPPNSRVDLASSLEDLLASSDVLSLHVPLTAGTRGMIGANELARLPAGAILVNTARGEVLDEPALVDALRSGRLVAAGLDTTCEEPIGPASPLVTLPNVVLTPHVGGSTPAALAAMAAGAANNVIGYLEGRPGDPRSCVNPEVLPAAGPAREGPPAVRSAHHD